jgi:hypothetical protein
MLQMDVMLVLLDLGLSGLASLLSIDLTTLIGHALRVWSIESQGVLHRPK